ncbi:unnamed protein product [Notodromas monacha]|uniref:Uncharacterized protein n=1 Tax=Notodromas monacha TaxID=399045 RepID=A0A7R9BJU3_9CRUS|nr:unnamed protein product [Notodromas monacha]CAG0915441.1 unnamed protein product [Notodromas monacha]
MKFQNLCGIFVAILGISLGIFFTLTNCNVTYLRKSVAGEIAEAINNNPAESETEVEQGVDTSVVDVAGNHSVVESQDEGEEEVFVAPMQPTAAQNDAVIVVVADESSSNSVPVDSSNDNNDDCIRRGLRSDDCNNNDDGNDDGSSGNNTYTIPPLQDLKAILFPNRTHPLTDNALTRVWGVFARLFLN